MYIYHSITFLIAEQFVHVLKQNQQKAVQKHTELVEQYRHFNGTKLLCLSSGLSAVPQNIFQLPSARLVLEKKS